MWITLLQVAALVLPWFSLPFLKGNAIKRYLPVTVFATLLVSILFQIADTYEWWTMHRYILPWGYLVEISVVYGIFPVGTLWIFYLSYRRLWIYIVTNLAVNTIFTFIGIPLILEGLGIVSFVNLEHWQWFLIAMILSFVIYGYQMWQEGIFKEEKT
ncbi:hypothetical protein [Virgibacillus alimentarius]|uniref:hypothetical protein n=1 Tax=Virgibacillus alimentarius TaxID=698769 RepID=UPI0004938A56|nr:hypothetical protein [Virgibacillus alimentarius]